jgi:SAM-dependent methyltransferase
MRHTAERLDPLLVARDDAFDQATLALHLERYRLAAEFARDADVVDCACGTGYGCELLAQAGARSVQGVDLDRDALAVARARHVHPAVTYYEADAVRYSAKPTPNLWVSVDVIEHLPNPTRYVEHVASSLAAGGRFVASVPVGPTTDGNPQHLWDFTRESFRALLKGQGFVEERKLEQSQRFRLGDVFGSSDGARRRARRRGLVGWYARHPSVFGQRLLLTLTKGLVIEYLTVVAKKKG